MTTFTRFMLATVLGLVSLLSAYGTHLTAGYISYAQDAADPTGKTYLFTLTLFRDTRGVDQPAATLNFGDGTTTAVDVSFRGKADSNIGNDIGLLKYEFKHVYAAAGSYTVAFTEENRNDGILNMLNSVQTPFHIESQFTINPVIGKNSSPVFTLPPIRMAEAGKAFVQNLAAVDPDGDSLAYQLITPFRSKNTPVDGYVPPNKVAPPLGTTEAGTGDATFTLNSIAGEIRWDAPGAKRSFGGVIGGPDDFGFYVISYQVEEWRKGYKLGTVQADMLVVVTAAVTSGQQLAIESARNLGFNESNQIKGLPGKPLTFSVRYKNTGGTNSTLKPGSELLSPSRNATVTVTDSADSKKARFTWTPTEQDRRHHPYIIVFRGAVQSPRRNELARDLTVSVFVGVDPVADKKQVESPTGPVTATEEWNREAMRVYPNPVTQLVRFTPRKQHAPVRLVLTDLTGKQCLIVNNLATIDFTLDMTGFPAGMYLYSITSRNRLIGRGKLVKR